MRYPGGYLNEDQFDSIRKGDWFCENCPGWATQYRYFWKSEIASRSSAPTFPPKPLLTDANAADRCVHGTYPPAICEHCQRQATTQEAVTLPTIIARMRAIGKDPAMVRSDVLLLFANDLEKVLARSQG